MTGERPLVRGHLPGAILVLVAGIICVRLGIWQLDRLAQRRTFNDHVSAAQHLPLLDLPAKENLTGQEYRAVRVVGIYDFDKQVAIRNQFYQNQYGYHLLTPLVIGGDPGGGATLPQAVLVDRGWIPAAGNATPADWHKYDEPGAVTVTGVIRLGGPAPTFAGLAEPTPSSAGGSIEFWTYIDVARIGQQVAYSLLPVYIQKSPVSGVLQPPIAMAPDLDLTEGPHLGYAIQWFGFAALFVVGYPVYVWKREARKE